MYFIVVPMVANLFPKKTATFVKGQNALGPCILSNRFYVILIFHGCLLYALALILCFSLELMS